MVLYQFAFMYAHTPLFGVCNCYAEHRRQNKQVFLPLTLTTTSFFEHIQMLQKDSPHKSHSLVLLGIDGQAAQSRLQAVS